MVDETGSRERDVRQVGLRWPTEVHPDEWVFTAAAIEEYIARHGEILPYPRMDDDR